MFAGSQSGAKAGARMPESMRIRIDRTLAADLGVYALFVASAGITRPVRAGTNAACGKQPVDTTNTADRSSSEICESLNGYPHYSGAGARIV